MINCVAYGSKNTGNYYVQLCGGEQHIGQKCDCKSLGENFTEVEAKNLAKQKSKELNVPLKEW